MRYPHRQCLVKGDVVGEMLPLDRWFRETIELKRHVVGQDLSILDTIDPEIPS